MDPNIWKAAKNLNKLRNDIAHNLDPKGLEQRVINFVELFPSGFAGENEPIQKKFEKSLLSLFVSMSALTEREVIELL